MTANRSWFAVLFYYLWAITSAHHCILLLSVEFGLALGLRHSPSLFLAVDIWRYCTSSIFAWSFPSGVCAFMLEHMRRMTFHCTICIILVILFISWLSSIDCLFPYSIGLLLFNGRAFNVSEEIVTPSNMVEQKDPDNVNVFIAWSLTPVLSILYTSFWDGWKGTRQPSLALNLMIIKIT
jgi:hypothetical protein